MSQSYSPIDKRTSGQDDGSGDKDAGADSRIDEAGIGRSAGHERDALGDADEDQA